MRGGQLFMESLLAHGVEAIFGNPGTTENSVLDRLIDYPSLSYYVALHEGIAVGAATFYAQASGKVPVVNLHVAPGLGNGIGMMYGALKAQVPMLVTAGAQDTRMRMRAPLLGHDLVGMAAPVTKWSAEPQSADELEPMLRRAFKIANDPPYGPVFVALPVNVMEQTTDLQATTAGALTRLSAPTDADIQQALALLRGAQRPAIVCGDDVAKEDCVTTLVHFAEAIGAPVYHEGLRGRLSFPNQHPHYRGRVPFEAANIQKLLAPYDLVILLGGPFFEEIWFDAQPAIPTQTKVLQIESSAAQLGLNHPLDLGIVSGQEQALSALLGELQAPNNATAAGAASRNEALGTESQRLLESTRQHVQNGWDDQPMTPARALFEIAGAMPEQGIVVDESITGSIEVASHFSYTKPDDYYAGRGGGIGQGLAGAIGVQVAHPNRPVIAISGDGSAMYSIQALWTAAHHELPIVFVILSNREYRVLKHNLDIYRSRFDIGSNKPYPHMDLSHPNLDFCQMAAAVGIGGVAISDPNDIAAAMATALASGQPRLIDIQISGKP